VIDCENNSLLNSYERYHMSGINQIEVLNDRLITCSDD
jgi:hypothetical protein